MTVILILKCILVCFMITSCSRLPFLFHQKLALSSVYNNDIRKLQEMVCFQQYIAEYAEANFCF